MNIKSNYSILYYWYNYIHHYIISNLKKIYESGLAKLGLDLWHDFQIKWFLISLKWCMVTWCQAKFTTSILNSMLCIHLYIFFNYLSKFKKLHIPSVQNATKIIEDTIKIITVLSKRIKQYLSKFKTMKSAEKLQIWSLKSYKQQSQ